MLGVGFCQSFPLDNFLLVESEAWETFVVVRNIAVYLLRHGGEQSSCFIEPLARVNRPREDYCSLILEIVKPSAYPRDSD